jgi:hypothetical protein
LPLQFEPRLGPILRFSYADQIDLAAEEVTPSTVIFGSEPAHGWCYYYQSAELAKQSGDWETVVRLGDEVLAANLTPVDRSEWLPFLAGYLWAGNEAVAKDITIRIADDAPLAKEICDALRSRPYRFGADIQQSLIEALCGE